MPLKAGTRLGPCEIVAAIGSGGMGEVYRARDTRLGREVAVKVLPESMATDEDLRLRFAQEARLIAALNHPNVMAVHDVGQESGIHYIVTELVEGKTLRQELAGGALPLQQAVEYAIQIARGLAAAHEKGIIHRDLKPENLLVTKDGRVKILDFGLARQVPLGRGAETIATQARTSPGMVLGTSGYMAPEQVRGEEVDHRADIFAFGTVLYEMLSGRRAFARHSAIETMSAVLNEEPPESSLRGGQAIPPGVQRIVQRCLKKNREARFQSARDLEFALEDYEAGEQPAQAGQPGRPRWSWLAVALLAVVLAGVAGAVWLVRSRHGSGQIGYQRLTFRNGSIHSARFGPGGDSIVYNAAWEGPEVRIYRARADGSEIQPLPVAGAELLSVSSEGEAAVSLKDDTLARLSLSGGSAPRKLLDNVYLADWFRDGRNLAVVRYVNGQSRLEAPVGKVVYQTNAQLSHMRVSPEGDAVAFMEHPVQGDDRGSVVLVDMKGNRRSLTGEWPGEQGLAWSPDGKEVWFSADASYDWDRRLYAVSRSGRQREVLRVPGAIYLEDIASDGRVLLQLVERRYEVVAGETGGAARILSWTQIMESGNISRDGRYAIITDMSGTGGNDYSHYLAPIDGSAPILLGNGSGADVSADDQWVAVIPPNDPSKVLVEPVGVGETKTIRAPNFQYQRAAFSADGHSLIVQASDGEHPSRFWVQPISGGAPRPITAEGIEGSIVTVRDSTYIWQRDADGNAVLIPVAGGVPERVPGMRPNEEVFDGYGTPQGGVYVVDFSSPASPGISIVPNPTALLRHIFELDLKTGSRRPLLTVSPLNPAGIEAMGGVRFSADGKHYLYDQARSLSVLYTVSGLR